MRSAAAVVLACGLVPLALSASATTATTKATPLDPAADPRLAQRFSVHSAGVPVSHVLRSLDDRSGVRLAVSGRAGDERVIAFVPGSSLAEIMTSLADLYNLEWSRKEVAGKPTYQLFKPGARLREEADLRAKALKDGLADLIRMAERAPRSWDESRVAMRKEALALVREQWRRLEDRGHLVFSLRDFPEHQRETLTQRWHAALEGAQQSVLEHDRQLRQEFLESGRPLPKELQEEPVPRPLGDPDSWKLTMDLRTHRGLELRVALNVEGFGSGIIFGTASQPETAGIALYLDRNPRPRVLPPPGVPLGDPPLPADDPLRRPLPGMKGRPAPMASPYGSRWLNALENLSAMSGLAVYSDDYSHAGGWLDREATSPRPGQGSGDYLDRLCSIRTQDPSSFWWHRETNVMIRSRGYLYQSETVLPTALIDALVSRAQGETIRLMQSDLSTLGRLTRTQLEPNLTEGKDLVAWRRAVELPSRLSLSSRLLTVSGGLTWPQLTPPDRVAVRELTRDDKSPVDAGFRRRVSAELGIAADPTRPVIRILMETEEIPLGSKWSLSFPAIQANPRALQVREAAEIPTRSRTAGDG